MFKKYYFTDFTEPETSDFEIPNSFLTFFDLEMNLQKSYGSLMVYYFSVSVKPRELPDYQGTEIITF